jgi:biopolymer transport protein ExbD
MRRKVKRGSDNADIDMTPMLDIVFILLIFFIVTATFLQESGDRHATPASV